MQSTLLSALRDIGLAHVTVEAALSTPHPADAQLARVVEVQRDHVLVHDGLGVHRALVWPSLRVALEVDRDAIVVGDWTWWQPVQSPGPAAAGWVISRVPARNRMTRLDPEGGRQPLVANIDVALLVMGLDHDYNLRRLDRFLVLAHSARAEAVVVLTKADGCASPQAALARTRDHAGPGLPVVALDARLPAARAALAPWLARGRTLVTVGSSGAGKTTLGNTLTGARGVTGDVRAVDERGRHTTTVRSLRAVPGGACLIDTPGLRQLRLDVDDQALNQAFADVVALAQRCQFRDCRHQGEPGCAVRPGVSAGRLSSYQKLLREQQRDETAGLRDRRRHRARMKQRVRDARERLQQKGHAA